MLKSIKGMKKPPVTGREMIAQGLEKTLKTKAIRKNKTIVEATPSPLQKETVTGTEGGDGGDVNVE